jgi:hypothetical protein
MIRLGFYNMWVLASERSTILRVFSKSYDDSRHFRFAS